VSDEAPEQSFEARQVLDWRYEQALREGLTKLEARLFAASDGDLEELRHLRETGCDAELAARIVI
jgi:hypothetical protein